MLSTTIRQFLDTLIYPYNDICVDYIKTSIEQNHPEVFKDVNYDTQIMKLTKIYWFDFVKKNLFNSAIPN